jgi:hypothetical protein
MAAPVSAAPPVDPKVIQQLHIVSVTAAGVRIRDTGPPQYTYLDAQTRGPVHQASVGASTYEIWPPAPPGHQALGDR